MPVLNSWKEIATFLHRGVRTVQRWESKNQLPVHRVGGGEKAPVFAFAEELQAWLRTFEKNEFGYSPELAPKCLQTDKKAIEEQRNLRADLRRLLHEHRQRMISLQRTLTVQARVRDPLELTRIISAPIH